MNENVDWSYEKYARNAFALAKATRKICFEEHHIFLVFVFVTESKS